MAQKPQIRVVVRLPYNRPQETTVEPPRVSRPLNTARTCLDYILKLDWTLDKENLLWEVIARSRAPDSGGTECKCKCNVCTQMGYHIH